MRPEIQTDAHHSTPIHRERKTHNPMTLNNIGPNSRPVDKPSRAPTIGRTIGTFCHSLLGLLRKRTDGTKGSACFPRTNEVFFAWDTHTTARDDAGGQRTSMKRKEASWNWHIPYPRPLWAGAVTTTGQGPQETAPECESSERNSDPDDHQVQEHRPFPPIPLGSVHRDEGLPWDFAVASVPTITRWKRSSPNLCR